VTTKVSVVNEHSSSFFMGCIWTFFPKNISKESNYLQQQQQKRERENFF
jgi:hypothetical protein